MHRVARGDSAASPKTTCQFMIGLMSRRPSSDFRHRALRHHTEGIFLCEKIFGVSINNSEGKEIPVRYIGEQHVREDLGRIPTAQDWLTQIKPERWMYGQRLQV